MTGTRVDAIRELAGKVLDGQWSLVSFPSEDSQGRPTGETEYYIRFNDLGNDSTLMTHRDTAQFLAQSKENVLYLLSVIHGLTRLTEEQAQWLGRFKNDSDAYRMGYENGYLKGFGTGMEEMDITREGSPSPYDIAED